MVSFEKDSLFSCNFIETVGQAGGYGSALPKVLSMMRDNPIRRPILPVVPQTYGQQKSFEQPSYDFSFKKNFFSDLLIYYLDTVKYNNHKCRLLMGKNRIVMKIVF